METATIAPATLEKIRVLYKEAGNARLTEKISGGYLSHNFILQGDNAKLFLKQYRFASLEKIEEIHRVKFFFRDGGIPIILPIKNNTGEYIFEDDGKFYALFPFVEGNIIRRKDRSPKAFASAGKMLGRIHALSKNGFPRIIDSCHRGWNKQTFLERAEGMKEKIEAIPKKEYFYKLALETLNCKIQLAKENETCLEDLSLRKDHIIHGDYHGQNIFYDNNDEVQNIFDIEKTEVSPRTIEIARAIDYMCFSNDYTAKSFDDASVFLSAYNEIYPLGIEELARGVRAYYLEKAHSIWIEEEHYIRGNFRVDCFLGGELLMLKYYSKNFNEFIDGLNIMKTYTFKPYKITFL